LQIPTSNENVPVSPIEPSLVRI